jgi:hypothetical protein
MNMATATVQKRPPFLSLESCECQTEPERCDAGRTAILGGGMSRTEVDPDPDGYFHGGLQYEGD